MSNLPKRYSKIAITLHWLIATMVIIALFIGGRMLAGINNSDPEKVTALLGHMIWGLVVGALMLARIVVRFTVKRPAPVSTGNTILNHIGGLVHTLLYLFVIAMVASGIGISILAGLPEIVFQGIGELPTNFNDLPPRAAHGLIAKILMGLILLHIAAALFHQFKLKDRLLSRMGIGKAID
ncbi:MAG: cytochrome b/b6 domain-containing protein [Gammaproteobacteria bacterium]|jgi:cytochrome b561|nr:cytochrome b/b6 domain-containing protein [Gammaproteobacteria bacterium]